VLILDLPFTFNKDRAGEILSPFEAHLTDQVAVLVLGLAGGMASHPEFGHPHVRPLDRMREVLTKTEGPILDPYMGTGTTLVAAKELGREAVGIEIEEKWCQRAVERMARAA
jgi:DNA modification methylase